MVSLLVLSALADTYLPDPSLTHYTSSVQLEFKPFDKSAQFSLIPCEGKMIWKIGTSPNPTTVACTSLQADKLCRYEFDNNLGLNSTVYITIDNVNGYDATFDFIASSSLTFYDTITPPTSILSIEADAYYSNPTTVVANVSWPDAFAAHGSFNYTIYSYELSDPSVLADNYFLNTSCGVRTIATALPTTSLSTANTDEGKVFIARNLPINPSVYTYFTVVADLIDPSYNITFSSAYNGVWVAPNSAAPYSGSGSGSNEASSNAPTGSSGTDTSSGRGTSGTEGTGHASDSSVVRVARLIFLAVFAFALMV